VWNGKHLRLSNATIIQVACVGGLMASHTIIPFIMPKHGIQGSKYVYENYYKYKLFKCSRWLTNSSWLMDMYTLTRGSKIEWHEFFN
jgi:hypothetical protein